MGAERDICHSNAGTRHPNGYSTEFINKVSRVFFYAFLALVNMLLRSLIKEKLLIVFDRVEWSSQFSLELSKKSVLRCQRSIRVIVRHPQCILPGRDKVRVYGHETLPVPSLLAPTRMSYIGEQQIRRNNRVLDFRCTMFPARYVLHV